jgi:hypothetical protein
MTALNRVTRNGNTYIDWTGKGLKCLKRNAHIFSIAYLSNSRASNITYRTFLQVRYPMCLAVGPGKGIDIVPRAQ